MKNKKINSIILDCDDVILDYRKGFDMAYPGFEDSHIYPKEKNLLFRQSESFASLEPCEFAIEFVKALKSLSYKVSIVTSVGNEAGVEEKRVRNINNVFGKDTFDEIYILPYFETKSNILAKFPKSFFIDDIAHNFSGSDHINIYKKKSMDNDGIPKNVTIHKTICNLSEALDFIKSY